LKERNAKLALGVKQVGGTCGRSPQYQGSCCASTFSQ
jgi:hypothetical protein